MKKHPSMKLALAVSWCMLAAMLWSCGGDDNTPNQDGDIEAEDDTVDEEPGPLVRLTVLGNLVPEYNGQTKQCAVVKPASVENANLRSEGLFDFEVLNYAQKHYSLNLWLKSEDLSRDHSGTGDITLSQVEIGYSPPPNWPTAAIPGDTIPLNGYFALGGDIVVPVDLFGDATASYINSIFDEQSVNELEQAGFLVEITIVALSPSASELRAVYRYPLKLCRGCIVNHANPETKCCYSDVDPNEIKRVQNFRLLLSSLTDQNERCYLFQDRDSMLYCSWLADCYNDVLNCPSYTCN